MAVPFLFVHRCHSHPLVFEFFYEKFQDRGNFKMYFDPVKTGKRLKALRLSRGLTQEKMAEKLNIFLYLLQNIMNGSNLVKNLLHRFVMRNQSVLQHHNRLLTIWGRRSISKNFLALSIILKERFGATP